MYTRLLTAQRALTIAVVAGITIAFSATGASAQTTWHVPADFSTIQEAIDAASSQGGDEIIVAPGTYNEAINFLGKAVHLRSSDGPEVTIIDASGLDTSVVRCISGEGSDTILHGFTITGGTGSEIEGMPEPLGGGMLNFNSSPTVSDCHFIGNSAHHRWGSGMGGGMVNLNSSPAVTNCRFIANSADIGGGMANLDGSDPIIDHCLFEENKAQWSAGDASAGFPFTEFGGGMYSFNSNATLTHCDFVENTADRGGGMYNIQSSPLVENCAFIENAASFGGGLYNISGSSPVVSGCLFDGNSAITGGGMRNEATSNPTVSNCNFKGNSASHSGGSIWNGFNSGGTIAGSFFCESHPDFIEGPWSDLGKNVFLTFCEGVLLVPQDFQTIQDAIDFASGGEQIVIAPGLYLESINLSGKPIHLRSSHGPALTILHGMGLESSIITCDSGEGPDTIIEGFGITGGNAQAGGGMRNINSSPTVINCGFFNNTADTGGGMHNQGGAPIVIGCSFVGNAAESGGGMYNDNSTPTISNSSFEKNVAVQGGGNRNASGSAPIIDTCSFALNNADRGGGIYANASDLTLTDCTFTNNLAALTGGGIYKVGSATNVTLTNCVFEGNAADGVLGGGGMYNAGGAATFTNCQFFNNTGSGGGALRNNTANSSFAHCTFVDNSAFLGGGIYATGSASSTLTDCLFDGNTAEQGAGLFNLYHTWTMTNCVFLNNAAQDIGGGMVSGQFGTVTLTASSFQGNSGGIGAGIWNSSSSATAIGDTLFCENDPDHTSGPFTDLGGNTFSDSCELCVGDLTGDGNVGVGDLLTLMGGWGACDDPDVCPADLNDDGEVNVFDLLVLLANWGPCL